MEKIIFHVDVNSAFLSWTAVELLKEGQQLDIRTVPSVVAGDPKTRTGVILAKSLPCKEFKITTGEPLTSAMRKCPNLLIYPTNFSKYIYYSNKMREILEKYSDDIEQFSIDEYFLTYIPLFGTYNEVATKIANEIYSTLGFTVNVGISTNKLLAKMASDFEKPNKVHTLFLDEIQKKMWPLEVQELFLVGPQTAKKLRSLGINTIGKLANTNVSFLKKYFNSHGEVIHNFANGIDNSYIHSRGNNKCIGNSGTSSFDITSTNSAYEFILGISENVSNRLRKTGLKAKTISLDIKNSNLQVFSHSISISSPTDITNTIYEVSKKLFNELWNGDPIRHMGINLSNLVADENIQLNLFDQSLIKHSNLDHAIDNIRNKFDNNNLIKRGCFINSKTKSMIGGELGNKK